MPQTSLFSQDIGGDWGNIHYSIKGPSWIAKRGTFEQRFRDELIRGFQVLSGEMTFAAERAYAGTRFEHLFEYVPSNTALRIGTILRNTHELFVFVDPPTRPHKIQAVNAPYLSFPWLSRGGWEKIVSVNHPGTKGKNLVQPIVDQYAVKFAMMFKVAFEQVLGE